MIARIVLSNGAILQRVANPCDVCNRKNEDVEPASHTVTFEGAVIHICEAHADDLTNLDADIRRKGGSLQEFMPDLRV